MTSYLCVDFGSTFTKALWVGDDGVVRGSASHRTTIDSDVMNGFDACVNALGEAAQDAQVHACSSAGGGLRIAVIGHEELVTAEAGRRVALSSGGKVVHVSWGRLDAPATQGILDQAPDVVLLTGGSDGGNAEVLLHNAQALKAARWPTPVVVAGNVEVRDQVAGHLKDIPHVLADNVVPKIGVLRPDSARAAIREMFLAHVIGGKAMSTDPRFVSSVRGATPDLVLDGLEVLADVAELPNGVAVVDIGGATTDVHSVVRLDAETAELGREVVAITPVTRTVEGDLGMRWSAASTAAAAIEAGLAEESLQSAGDRRTADPGYLPGPDDLADECSIASAAAVLGVRRHTGRSRVVISPEGRVVERTGTDLREIDLLIGSGGVFRHNAEEVAHGILGAATGVHPDGWQQPEHPRLGVDTQHVLPALGLLAQVAPDVTARLASSLLRGSADIA